MTEILNSKPGTEVKNVSAVLAQIQKLKFSEANEAAREMFQEFYSGIKNARYTNDERIMIMANLNQMSEFYTWLLGDFLMEEEKRIEENWHEWKNSGSIPEYRPPYKSLNRFLEYYGDDLGISQAKMYQCLDVRRNFDIDTLLELGITKLRKISIIKDTETRDMLVEKTRTEAMDFETLNLVTNAVATATKIEDEKQRKAQIRQIFKDLDDNDKLIERAKIMKSFLTEQKEEAKEDKAKIFKKYRYDVTLPPDNDKAIVIIAKSKAQKDNLVKALNYYEQAIKNYLLKCDQD